MGNYPAPASNKIQYDKDGTVVGYNIEGGFASGITEYADNALKISLNKYDRTKSIYSLFNNATKQFCFWFFFPKEINFSNIAALFKGNDGTTFYELQGSSNTTNGVDGIWETVVFPSGQPAWADTTNVAWWRDNIKPITFTKPCKAIRMRFDIDPWGGGTYGDAIFAFHLYGSDAVDDGLIITNSGGAKITSLIDLGDTARGSVFNQTIYVKNASALAASNITIDIEGTAYTTSLDNATFNTTQKTIASLAAGAVSAPIYVRFSPVSGTTLGPGAGRILVNGTLG